MIFTLEADFNPYSPTWDENEVKVLWSPGEQYYEFYHIYDIQLKKQINHADSLTFTMTPDHPHYNLFTPQKALGISVGLRQYNANKSGTGFPFLFYGRCVTIDNDRMGTKKITCEGALAFLNDIILRPVSFATSTSEPYDYEDMKTWHEYFLYIFGKFQTRMGGAIYGKCPKRCMTQGLINTMVEIKNSQSIDACEHKRYSGIDDYITVMDAVNDLISVDSRLMVYTQSGVDWGGNVYTNLNITLHPSDNPTAVMKLDKNIVDISPSGSAFDMYTAILPLDKNKLCLDTAITTSDVRYHKTEMNYDAQDVIWSGDLEGVGYIEKVVNLSEYSLNPDGYDESDLTKDKDRIPLQNRATEILNKASVRAVDEYTVNMVDLSLLGCVEREPFTAHTQHNNLSQDDIIGRTESALDSMFSEDEPLQIDIYHQKYTPSVGDLVLYGCSIYTLTSSASSIHEGHTLYKWEKVEDANYIPFTTTPIDLDPFTNPIIIDFDEVYCDISDKVVHEDYNGKHVYQYNGSKWEIYADASYLNHKTNGFYDYMDANNFIDIAHRVHFTCPEYGIVDDYYRPWVCTSLSMNVDNQAASSYTFSIIDEKFVPPDNILLSDLARAISNTGSDKHKEVGSNGTNYMGAVQPINVVKLDDNHVIEFYPDREVHYVAEGEGDVRTNIKSYDMPVGTTDPSDPWPEPNDS